MPNITTVTVSNKGACQSNVKLTLVPKLSDKVTDR